MAKTTIDTEHLFGNASTDLKLAVIEGYLSAYTTALTGKFTLWYIDAFAGTGERTIRHAARGANLWEASSSERTERRRGSARIAIDTLPAFDRLVFMDTKRSHCLALEALKAELDDPRITVVRADANAAIQAEIARTNWSRIRAVMFLDPYGMHVDWKTLEAIRSTGAIDVWYLVSLSGLFRQATRDPRSLSDQKRAAITRMLGTGAWETEWYEAAPHQDLFGQVDEITSRTADVNRIEVYVRKRLETLFPKVLAPKRLHNERGAPMFALFFATSNSDPKAMGLASRIAGHLLKSGI